MYTLTVTFILNMSKKNSYCHFWNIFFLFLYNQAQILEIV